MNWINVKDKLPEIGQRVLSYNEDEGMKETKYTTFQPGSFGHKQGYTNCWFEWVAHNNICWKHNATHWAELPEPPKNK